MCLTDAKINYYYMYCMVYTLVNIFYVLYFNKQKKNKTNIQSCTQCTIEVSYTLGYRVYENACTLAFSELIIIMCLW